MYMLLLWPYEIMCNIMYMMVMAIINMYIMLHRFSTLAKATQSLRNQRIQKQSFPLGVFAPVSFYFPWLAWVVARIMLRLSTNAFRFSWYSHRPRSRWISGELVRLPTMRKRFAVSRLQPLKDEARGSSFKTARRPKAFWHINICLKLFGRACRFALRNF